MPPLRRDVAFLLSFFCSKVYSMFVLPHNNSLFVHSFLPVTCMIFLSLNRILKYSDPLFRLQLSPFTYPQLLGSLGHHRWLHNQFPPFFLILHCPLGLGELQALSLSAVSSSPFLKLYKLPSKHKGIFTPSCFHWWKFLFICIHTVQAWQYLQWEPEKQQQQQNLTYTVPNTPITETKMVMTSCMLQT